MNLIQFTLGDWSDDGHGKTSIFIYDFNKPLSEVRVAYRRGVRIMGVDMFDIAKEYEDNTISPEIKEKFICLKDDSDLELHEGEYQIFTDHYMNMILEIIFTGDPTISCKESDIKAFNGYWTKEDRFNVFFGYGLFS